MQIPPIGSPTAYDTPQSAPTTVVTEGKPVQIMLGLPTLDVPTLEALQRETANFAELVGKIFRAAGIEIPPEPILAADQEGQVRVSNKHPDQARIEQIFVEHEELRQGFAKVSSWSSLQRMAANYQHFSDDYARLQGDPEALRARVDAEIARSRAPFFMAVSSRGIETFFGNPPGISA